MIGIISSKVGQFFFFHLDNDFVESNKSIIKSLLSGTAVSHSSLADALESIKLLEERFSKFVGKIFISKVVNNIFLLVVVNKEIFAVL